MMKNLFNNSNLHLRKMDSGSRPILTFLVLVLLISPVLAFSQNGSTFTVSAWDNGPFTLEVNQKRYEARGSITLKNVTAGTSKVKVYRRSSQNSTHMNSNQGGLVRMLYRGTVTIPVNSRVRAEVDQNRRLNILDVSQLFSTNKPQRPNRPIKPNRPMNNGGFGTLQCGTPNNNYYPSSNFSQHHGFTPYSYEQSLGFGGVCAMNQPELNQIIHSMNSACFSEDKLRIATQALRHNLITVDQLIELLSVLDFDSSKLELAKRAYPKLIDKTEVWRVNDAFTFTSTARAFDEHIWALGC